MSTRKVDVLVMWVLCACAISACGFRHFEPLGSAQGDMSCAQLNQEINEAYSGTRQTLGLARAARFVLLFPLTLSAYERDSRELDKARDSAKARMNALLLAAQQRKCAVNMEWDADDHPLRQEVAFRGGELTMKCNVHDDIPIYVAHVPFLFGNRDSRLDVLPPGGTTILLANRTTDYPTIVQRFIYQRACEAARIYMELDAAAGIDRIGWTFEGVPDIDCRAIKALTASRVESLDENGFREIARYLAVRQELEFAQNQIVLITNCYRTAAGND